MELSSAIRKGFFSALSGITYNGQPVAVYDSFALPESAGFPYILLSSQTSSERLVKGCKMWGATLLVDIVTGSLNPVGRFPAEQIAEQVETRVNTTDIDISLDGYQLAQTRRESDTELPSKNNQYFIFRKLMRYSFKINKL